VVQKIHHFDIFDIFTDAEISYSKKKENKVYQFNT